MTKKLLFAGLAVAATLASCEKSSMVDTTLTSNQTMVFAPYAGASATRGNAVNSNADFCGTAEDGNTFKVSALIGNDRYFGFNDVTYGANGWENQTAMYWPNADATIDFAALYPSDDASRSNLTYTQAGLKFDYAVTETVGDQIDLMYAISEVDFEAPATGTNDAPEANSPVGLHFKHALTQVAFTATKDADINVTVNSIKICNVVNNGKFVGTSTTNNNGGITEDQDKDEAVTAGAIWTPATAQKGNANTNLSHYDAVMASTTGIVIDGTTSLTSKTAGDAMMLLPQSLTKWNPTAANVGTESFLAIDCVITHNDGTAPIVDGTIYVPFSTDAIPYKDGAKNGWLPGYIITYNLNFGGGYTIPEPDPEDPKDPEVPKPGETPDPEVVVPTLRPITYNVTVDEWIPVAGGTIN